MKILLFCFGLAVAQKVEKISFFNSSCYDKPMAVKTDLFSGQSCSAEFNSNHNSCDPKVYSSPFSQGTCSNITAKDLGGSIALSNSLSSSQGIVSFPYNDQDCSINSTALESAQTIKPVFQKYEFASNEAAAVISFLDSACVKVVCGASNQLVQCTDSLCMHNCTSVSFDSKGLCFKQDAKYVKAQCGTSAGISLVPSMLTALSIILFYLINN